MIPGCPLKILKKDRLVELHYICASRFYCNLAVFKVIFDAIPFMSVSSNYVYIQRRGYRIECSLLWVKIRNTSVFMGLWILSERLRGKLEETRMHCFFLSPSNHRCLDVWQLSDVVTSMKLGMQFSNNIPQGGFLRSPGQKYFF